MCNRPRADRAEDVQGLDSLARMLHAETALSQVSNMQLRAALELAEQRGWKITKETTDA